MADALDEHRIGFGDKLVDHGVARSAIAGANANFDEFVVIERAVEFGEHGRAGARSANQDDWF